MLLVLSLMVMEVNGRRFESQLLAVGLFINVIIYIEMFRISISSGVVIIIGVVVVIIIVDVAIDFSIFFDTFGFGLVEGVIIVAVVIVIAL